MRLLLGKKYVDTIAQHACLRHILYPSPYADNVRPPHALNSRLATRVPSWNRHLENIPILV